MNPYKYLLKHLSHLSIGYQKLVTRTYLAVVPQILFYSKRPLLKGIYFSFSDQEKKEKSFIEGSVIWGSSIIKNTESTVKTFGDSKIPDKGHLIFINHVNELDFPFDCVMIQKPFLANQVIKSTYVAYWWMKAMGSKVFDTSHARTISHSVRQLVEGLKNHSYIVYPEGHNSYSEEIKNLKKGMIKLAHDNKIPIFLVLKSGIANLQVKQKGNQIGYKFSGVIDPNEFTNWEDLKIFIFNKMVEEKNQLDAELAKL